MFIEYDRNKETLSLCLGFGGDLCLKRMKLEYFYKNDISKDNTFIQTNIHTEPYEYGDLGAWGSSTKRFFNQCIINTHYHQDLVQIHFVLTSYKLEYVDYSHWSRSNDYRLIPYVADLLFDLYLTTDQFEKIFLNGLSGQLIQQIRKQLNVIPCYPYPKPTKTISYSLVEDSSEVTQKIYTDPQISYEPKQPVTIRSSLKVLLYGIVGGILVFIFLLVIVVATH